MPPAMNDSERLSKCACISSAMSASRFFLRKSERNEKRKLMTSGRLGTRTHDPPDREHELVPRLLFGLELFPPSFGQRIEFRAAVVFRLTPLRLKPAFLL